MPATPHRTGFGTEDELLLGQALGLLDHVVRESGRCAVAVHAATAAQHIQTACPARDVGASCARADDRTNLTLALRLLARLSDHALGDDRVADAMHLTMLAYLAAR